MLKLLWGLSFFFIFKESWNKVFFKSTLRRSLFLSAMTNVQNIINTSKIQAGSHQNEKNTLSGSFLESYFYSMKKWKVTLKGEQTFFLHIFHFKQKIFFHSINVKSQNQNFKNNLSFFIYNRVEVDFLPSMDK